MIEIEEGFDKTTEDYTLKNEVLQEILDHDTFEDITTLREEIAFLVNYSRVYASSQNNKRYKFKQIDIAKLLGLNIDQVKYHFKRAKDQYNCRIKEIGRPTTLSKSEIKQVIEWIQTKVPEPKLKEVKTFISTNFKKFITNKSLTSYLNENNYEVRTATPMEEARYYCDSKKIRYYFEKLKGLTESNAIPSKFVFNVDEEGCDDFVDAINEKVIVHKNKQGTIYFPVERKANRSTLIGCISACGEALKPLIVTKRKTIDYELIQEGVDPTNVMLQYSPTGFITRDLFIKWIDNVFVPYVEQSRTVCSYKGIGILIMDNCTAHCSQDIIDKLMKINICVVFYLLTLHI